MQQVVFLASIDWDSPWQRHQAFASVFARNGYEVFFIENCGFRGLRLSDSSRVLKRAKNIFSAPKKGTAVHVVAPAVLPPSGRLSQVLNKYAFIPRLLQKLRGLGLKKKPAVFAYLPTPTTLKLLQALNPGLVVYDCVDFFKGHPSWHKDFEDVEDQLLRQADCVLTTSPFLYELLRTKHLRVHELHHGVANSFFQQIATAKTEFAYKKFCYFGTLWSAIDYEPIAALAEAGFEVTLIGPVKEALPPLPPRVKVAGPVPVDKLPQVLAEFDGYLLPYANSPYNQGVVPAKTYECLASGKPVLCSPLPNFEGLKDFFYIARTARDWVEIAQKLPELETAQKRQARVELAKKHFTDIQFTRLRSILTEIESKKTQVPVS